MRVYLAGPIYNCTDEQVRGWRDTITPTLESRGHTVIDPSRRDYRGKEGEKFDEIVRHDKDTIRHCEALVANLPLGHLSVGTVMEIMYAFDHGKIVLVCSGSRSPWLRAHCHAFPPSFHMVVEVLEGFRR